ncbi:MAG: TRAP transporter substrate-binding protein [Nitrospinaceae bacterium]|jgi:TRAP-type transport system periplasmic protein|nr:TRAP transporter substrate-binding protein [Nitrospinaceae bacterium]MBT3433869.1 TRAP transporter substrate-binding protein [Nitrospinaceae bacterium]MBT3820391.1 TRAP transporter substrate-binding protein [Nitrospinaceae bacterium]MBT4095429.1 TRAP transporter substrate-binding protein [Nitrospinaceae bacterium]MBT4429010.1 TRAP transporter substrate-binding protein [Nitrospinaceae bacterium]
MSENIIIRLGGYSPPDSTHSLASVHFKESLEKQLGDEVTVDLFWNVLDFGYRADDLLSMVECGLLTMCYFSTSYVTSRVPELEIIDLPFVFENEAAAHAALDGALGDYLTEKTENRTGYRVLGYWDNGFRHLSNRLRPVRSPADCKDMRVRLQPNEVHIKTFEMLGAVPVAVDLKEGIEKIVSHDVDAQENPLANTVTYGVDKHHNHVTMSGHFFGARGLYTHKDSFDSWPESVQLAVRKSACEAIQVQRQSAFAKEEELRVQMLEEGIEVISLTSEEREAFKKAVLPVLDEARSRLGNEIFSLLG